MIRADRQDDLRYSGARCRVRRARAAVVDYYGGARQQPFVRNVASDEKIAWKHGRIDVAPAGSEDGASSADRIDQCSQRLDPNESGGTAEACIDRRFAGREEIEQLRWRLRIDRGQG